MHFDMIHNSRSSSDCAIIFNKVTCDNLTTPIFYILSLDLNIPGEQENFSSDVNSIVV
jgi:hypothetical protein